MGSQCFNWINGDKDLLVKKNKFKEEIDNSESQTITQINTYPESNKYYLRNPSINIINYNYNYNNSLYMPNSSSGFNYNNNYNNNEELYNNTPKIKLIKRSNSFKLVDNGKQKRIHKFTREELEDEINDILRIRIPFFENNILKTISAFTFLSGNGPYHEGLLFFTTNKNFYIAQSYPITFIKVYDFYAGISEIISFNNLNSSSKKYNIPEIYMPQQRITLFNVLNIINSMPNKYDLLNENCQNFCNTILETLQNKYRIELDDNPSQEKINFLRKQQKKSKVYNIPFNKVSLYGSRFNK